MPFHVSVTGDVIIVSNVLLSSLERGGREGGREGWKGDGDGEGESCTVMHTYKCLIYMYMYMHIHTLSRYGNEYMHNTTHQ